MACKVIRHILQRVSVEHHIACIVSEQTKAGQALDLEGVMES